MKGFVVSGSFSEGVFVKISGSDDFPGLGEFVCIENKDCSTLAVVSDISLESKSQESILGLDGNESSFFKSILLKENAFILIKIDLLISFNKDGLFPIKKIPKHFSKVRLACQSDFETIFGKEDFRNRLCVGSPINLDSQVCLNLKNFVERSNGIFGKTGTGKTFITRVILSGLIKSGSAVNLIFDMHSEYGIQARSEETQSSFVKGLKSLVPDKVSIFSLDPESTIKRGCQPDLAVKISLSEISVEDIVMLQSELCLHPTAYEAANLLYLTYKKKWLEVLFDSKESFKELASKIGAHTESLGALYRKLKRIEAFDFIYRGNEAQEDVFDTLVEYLDRGINVVLEFGRRSSTLCYLLVSGIVTRKIHKAYVKKTEKFLATKNIQDMPSQLVITVEEAHKFLNSASAKQTIFGTIAREMRKYFVSLLIVDQRPSGICDEVVSQLGTKIVAKLDDNNDINAVFSGSTKSSELRSILSTLSSKKEALVFGHSVPIPIAIKTRLYDDNFYKLIEKEEKPSEKLISDIYF